MEVDNRISLLIKNGVENGHRTMFVIIGDKAKDLIVYLHQVLSKQAEKSSPTVLWCHKKEIGCAFHRKKKMKSSQKKKKIVDVDDPFEFFLSSTNIRYCLYKDTHKILGNTFGMCVLQDFEAMTPNLLARTVETVEGGGIIVILLSSVDSLKELFIKQMDVHKRFRTEAHQEVIPRFNERFFLSLSSCARCLVIDDKFHVLPISVHNLKIEPMKKSTSIENNLVLDVLIERLPEIKPVSSLLKCCKTLDQEKALLKFILAISEKTQLATVSLTAARGRGKSATMGLAIAGAIALGYTNIFVTSPSPENLITLFDFIFKGLVALDYKENIDFKRIYAKNPDLNKGPPQMIVQVDILRKPKQRIQFIHPSDTHLLQNVELLVIDEAAAIPLPLVKAMFGPYLIFLASTINGYEGTGRSLSLKLIEQLRIQSKNLKFEEKNKRDKIANRVLEELTLKDAIRYKSGDDVENWLSKVLCLDENLDSRTPTSLGLEFCQLLYVNKETLFSFDKSSELVLQQLVSLFVASHYKNSPDDLQMMADAPAHHLFCLVLPANDLPKIVVCIQVCLEGQISKNSVEQRTMRGENPPGDLIPWTISNEFDDTTFPTLRGVRIVRIATHPDYQGKGYGIKALELLKEYYSKKDNDADMRDLQADEKLSIKSGTRSEKRSREEESDLLTEIIEPQSTFPLFMTLSERPAEVLDYIGVSFGLTEQLLKFWKRAKFIPVYIRQTPNDITGEHTCIMIHRLKLAEQKIGEANWLQDYWVDFRLRFIGLLSKCFKNFASSLALSILENNAVRIPATTLTKAELNRDINSNQLRRLDKFNKNILKFSLILDLIQPLAKLYFSRCLGNTNLLRNQENSSLILKPLQAAILLAIGLQHKTIDDLAKELSLQNSQVLGLVNESVKNVTSYLKCL